MIVYRSVENEEIPGNYLISYRLIGVAEESFVRSSEIEFILSKIDKAITVRVPDFLNGSLSDADIWANNNGINYDYNYSPIYDEGRIMYQSCPGKSGHECE